MIGENIRRSSFADEYDIRQFMLRTGQTEECIFTHGLVTGPDFAMPLTPSPCVCGAVV